MNVMPTIRSFHQRAPQPTDAFLGCLIPHYSRPDDQSLVCFQGTLVVIFALWVYLKLRSVHTKCITNVNDLYAWL